MAYDARKNELQHIVHLAENIIKPILARQKAGLITKEESINEGVEIINRMTFKDNYGDNYIFMTNYEGVMLAIQFQPEKRGISQIAMQDVNGKYLIQEIIKIAKSKAGKGFVDYYYLPPGRVVQQKKVSYIVGIPEWDAYIGTGMYTEDLDRYNKEGINTIILVGALSLVIMIFAGVMLVRPMYLCHKFLLTSFEKIQKNPDKALDLDIGGFNVNSESGKLLSSFSSMLDRIYILKDEKEVAQAAALYEIKKSEELKSKFLDEAEKMVFERTVELTKAQAELEKLARVDALTSLYNRRVFDEVYERTFSSAKRNNNYLSIIIIDVDYFKKFNDRYGHHKGDQCLQAISICIKRHAQRVTDTATRYGGEEFAIIMSDTDAENALVIAERIRSEVEEQHIPHKDSSHHVVTVSMGISTLVEDVDISRDQLFENADKALYKAKETGRNKVVVM